MKIFTIPIHGGEDSNEELNQFLRSKKVLQVETQLVTQQQGSYWCFCVQYVQQGYSFGKKKEKVDYKQVLDEKSFQRFSKLREIRKRVSKEDAVPAFAVFTDEELAGLAKLEHLTEEKMKSIKGIGEKKVEKYGKYFLSQETHEKKKSSD